MKIAVTTTSVPYHTVNFHRNLKESGYDATLLEGDVSNVDWSRFDVLWHVGYFLSANIDVLCDMVKKRSPKTKMVAHWVGTDLLQLGQFTAYRKKCLSCVLENVDLHVADNVNFIKELYEVAHVDARYVTLIPEVPLELKPLPEKFSVACYVPNERAEFYRLDKLLYVASKFPEVDFNFFRTEGKPSLPNCHFLGWVKDKEKHDLFEKCSVSLSIPVHGSLSVLCIEMLQMGRRAITSEPHPYCLQAQKPDDIVCFLTELKENVNPDEEASKFYREEYSPKHQLELVEQALKKL